MRMYTVFATLILKKLVHWNSGLITMEQSGSMLQDLEEFFENSKFVDSLNDVTEGNGRTTFKYLGMSMKKMF